MESYKKAWKTIVQPPKCNYDVNKDLPVSFIQEGEQIRRHKFQIPSSDPDEQLEIFMYHSEERQIKYILIYLHSFSGSALEGTFLLKEFLPHYSVILFDQRGCGNNKSEFVTLGLRESIDINLLIQNLQQKFEDVQFYFWGRQMGAVAILHFLHQLEASIFYYNYRINFTESTRNVQKLHRMSNFLKYKNDKEQCKESLKKQIKHSVYPLKKLNQKQYDEIVKRYISIKRVVYDTPFPSSHSIIKQILIKHSKLNKIMAQMALMPVTHSVKNVLGFDVLGQNKPYKKTEVIKVPGLFFIGEQDDIIDFNKFKIMFDNYSSEEKKLRIMLFQNHGDQRPMQEINVGKEFLFNGYIDEYKKNNEEECQSQKQIVDETQHRTNQNLIDLKESFEQINLNDKQNEDEIIPIKRNYEDLILVDQSDNSISMSSLSQENMEDEKQFIEEFEKEIIENNISIDKENLSKFRSQVYEFKEQLINYSILQISQQVLKLTIKLFYDQQQINL